MFYFKQYNFSFPDKHIDFDAVLHQQNIISALRKYGIVLYHIMFEYDELFWIKWYFMNIKVKNSVS